MSAKHVIALLHALPGRMGGMVRAAAALLALLLATAADAQSPQFRAASQLNGSGTLSYPAGSQADDWLVLSVITLDVTPPPAGWTQVAAYNWTAHGYRSFVFARKKGSSTSVPITTSLGGAVLAAYQNAGGIGAVGTMAESTDPATTLTVGGITPQHPGSVLVGIITDRGGTFPVPPSGITARVNYGTSYFALQIADRAAGGTQPTGDAIWSQTAGYRAVGLMVEVLHRPSPTVAQAFSPTTIAVNGQSTLSYTLGNANGVAVTNARFTHALSGMAVAGSALGGTCAGVTSSPALVASLAPGSCTITIPVTASTVGTYGSATSGATSTQTPVAGAPSNAASLTVIASPTPPTLTQVFQPAWTASGSTAQLVFTLTSPSGVALSNVNFSNALVNMTLAASTFGGSCAAVTNSPALAIGAASLNVTVPSVPVSGCTVTVQVTSSTLGSHLNQPSGAVATEASGSGAVPAAAYLTVTEGGDEFYYVHADHLGTPRAISKPSDNSLVWRWDNAEPFGNSSANENPTGLGAFKFQLRFPGQYADAETGTNYNYFRNYDPVTGRYVESDPIGLGGGLSTFGYANANPTRFVDPTGEISLTEVGLGVVLVWGGVTWINSQNGKEGKKSNGCEVCDGAGASRNPMPDPCDLMPDSPLCQNKKGPGVSNPEFPRAKAPTPPNGMTKAQLGELVGWGDGPGGAIACRARLSQADITRMRNGGMGRNDVTAWRDFYRDVYSRNTNNLTASERAALMDKILKAW